MKMDPSADQEKPVDTSSDRALTVEDLEAYDIKTLHRGDMRSGVVVRQDDAGLIVDIGYKREGFVPAGDLARLEPAVRDAIEVGQEIAVSVLRPEDREGRPILSVHQAVMQEDWLKADLMLKGNEVFEGEISDFNRGGVVVPFGRIRGFVPASQLVGIPRKLNEDERRKRLEAKVGETVGLKIIEVDRRRRRLIFSQRRALRAWEEKKRKDLILDLQEGDIRTGRVTDIVGFGAFVDLGGADGLIHVSELSWKRVENPHDVLKVGDEFEVYVLSVDRERKRIALSRKRLLPDPWTQVDDTYQVGQIVEGRVTRVVDFGAFIELDLGIEGLLHASEMIGTPELKPAEVVRPSQRLPVKIIRIESRRKRLALSARQIRRDEWERWMSQQQMEEKAEEAEEPTVEQPCSEGATKTKESADAEAPIDMTAVAKPEGDAEPLGGDVSAETIDSGDAEATVDAAAEFESVDQDVAVVADSPHSGEAILGWPAVLARRG